MFPKVSGWLINKIFDSNHHQTDHPTQKKKTSPNLSIKGCSRSWLLWSPPLGKKHPQVVVESVVEIFPRVGFSGEKTSGFWKILWWGWSKVMTFTSWWNTTSWIRSLYMYLLIHSLRSWKWGFWQKMADLSSTTFWVSIEMCIFKNPSHIQPAPRSPGPTSDPFDAGWPISDSSEMSAMKAPNARHLEPTEHNGDIKWSHGNVGIYQ